MSKHTAVATLHTNYGDIKVNLFGNHAPKTVKNFVGLATGEIEWTNPSTGAKTTDKLYDGVVFHRIIPGFMIQGGDPLGNGTGGPGFQFDDEINPELDFTEPYILAMANAGIQGGRGTNGSQFFITVGPTTWLQGKHTIFGEVEDDASRKIVDKLAELPDRRTRPSPRRRRHRVGHRRAGLIRKARVAPCHSPRMLGRATCYRHPDRAEYVLCQRCGRTICPECQTPAAVGVICPECMAQQRASAPKTKPAILTTDDRARRPGRHVCDDRHLRAGLHPAVAARHRRNGHAGDPVRGRLLVPGGLGGSVRAVADAHVGVRAREHPAHRAQHVHAVGVRDALGAAARVARASSRCS